MQESDTPSPKNQLNFSKKIWITGGIFSLLIILILLFKTLFSVILLALAGILLAVYFRGFANMLHRTLHWPNKLCLFLSVFINIILVAGFFWFVGARLQQQISELSDTLPQTIQHVKEQLGQTKTGTKVLAYINNSFNSIKTESVAKHFFSSSFGVLSDLYIVLLFGVFFTVDPLLYKKGVVHLLPEKAKEKGDKLLDELNAVLKKWLKAQIIGFFFIAVFHRNWFVDSWNAAYTYACAHSRNIEFCSQFRASHRFDSSGSSCADARLFNCYYCRLYLHRCTNYSKCRYATHHSTKDG